MKINISRQYLYLLALSLLLLIFVLVFSFVVLIPEGKDYRIQRTDLRKESRELKRYQDFHDETLERLKKLQGDKRHIITAFDTAFNPRRFEKQNKEYFHSLSLSKQKIIGKEDEFTIYEVNTTSQMNSPKSFYDFLDAINKSDWIISVNFPINFKREADMIKSSFTMKVYTIKNSELNSSE
jgi:hypothetical protein